MGINLSFTTLCDVYPLTSWCPFFLYFGGYFDKVIKELKKQERSLRWLSRKVGLHYMTVQYWVKNGVPRWHRVKVARALKRKVGDLFKVEN